MGKVSGMGQVEEMRRQHKKLAWSIQQSLASLAMPLAVGLSLAGGMEQLAAQQNVAEPPPSKAASAPAPPTDSSVLWPDVIAPATSQHALKLCNRTISYVATWSSILLKNAAGEPQATISATSYVRQDVPDRAQRPIIFAFNGGPGASSSPLHFGILGPRRLGQPDAAGKSSPIDNPETLLDVADLVMIDPVGTGFSRELSAGGGPGYWNPEGDAKAAETVIRDWLRDNSRASSLVFIVGESFGGYRLAEMAKDIGELKIAGLILVSPGTDMTGEAGISSDQHFVFTLPSMATTAFAHHKSQAGGRSVEQVYEEARSLAQGDYVEALQLGSELREQDRDQLAGRMANLIGLPPS